LLNKDYYIFFYKNKDYIFLENICKNSRKVFKRGDIKDFKNRFWENICKNSRKTKKPGKISRKIPGKQRKRENMPKNSLFWHK
jgi:hypothetical protein